MCAVLFFMGQNRISFANMTGKVTVPSAKIRQSADVNSEVIGSSAEGKTVEIISEVTDSSGTVWYEVYVNANTKGYIRSDLVSKDESSGSIVTITQNSDDTESAQNTAASGAEIPAETEMDAQYAVVKVPAAKIRSGASTTNGIVDTLSADTQIIVSGQTNGNDGKVWYYVTFTGTNGEQKSGYVRSDLVTLGEAVPVEEPAEEPHEESPVEEPAAETTEHKDYELVYEANEEGEYGWYLHDWTSGRGTSLKLSEILAAVEMQEHNDEIDASTISKQRIVIIILITVIILLAVVMTLMFFKLRDAYYETYEDDDEEDGEENKKRKEPVRKSSSVREDRQPVRKRTVEQEGQMPVKEVTYEEDSDAQVRTAPKRKAKNFLIEDDDFEFEFLNMKDKNTDM